MIKFPTWVNWSYCKTVTQKTHAFTRHGTVAMEIKMSPMEAKGHRQRMRKITATKSRTRGGDF